VLDATSLEQGPNLPQCQAEYLKKGIQNQGDKPFFKNKAQILGIQRVMFPGTKPGGVGSSYFHSRYRQERLQPKQNYSTSSPEGWEK